MNHLSRLKTRLNLPPIEPRPPIPPRVYKRLFTHLDNILPGRQVRSSTLTPKTPKTRDELGTPIRRSEPRPLDRSVSRSATRVTPKQITLVHTPTKSTSKGFVGRVDPAVGLHPWVRGVLGVLISETGRQRWGRLVLAGVQDVLTPGNKRTGDPWVSTHLPAVVAAIFAISIFVVDKVTGATGRLAQEDMADQTIKIMKQARKELDVKGMSDEEFWDGWAPLRVDDVTKGIKRAEEEWTKGEWFLALLEAAEDERAAERETAKARSGKKKDVQETRAQIRKADTMHLAIYNFLTPEKREAQAKWKADMISRIEAVEVSGSGETAVTESAAASP